MAVTLAPDDHFSVVSFYKSKIDEDTHAILKDCAVYIDRDRTLQEDLYSADGVNDLATKNKDIEQIIEICNFYNASYFRFVG